MTIENEKTTFALFFGNRGFFPASLIAQAREELPRVLKEWGHDVLMLEEDATRYGAVELGLGVDGPEKIELITDDLDSEAYAAQIREILT